MSNQALSDAITSMIALEAQFQAYLDQLGSSGVDVVRVRRNNAGALASATEIALSFDQIISDDLPGAFNLAAPTQFVVPAGYRYVQMFGQIAWEPTATDALLKTRVLLNGLNEGDGYGASTDTGTNPLDIAITAFAGAPVAVAEGSIFTIHIRQIGASVHSLRVGPNTWAAMAAYR